MFTLGYRSAIIQELALGADIDGTLVSFRHNAVAMTSQFEDFQRSFVSWSSLLYRCANSELTQRLVKLDQNTPADMRGPGGAEGVYAIECAMDELAYAADVDPLELRLNNYSDRDQIEDRPYSSKQLRECYRQGAEKFGWSNRKPQPRSMRDGNELVGWGMATGIWEAMQMPASARAVLTANGSVEIASATADIGPGTYTMMAQLAAELLGVPLDNVTVKLGDSALPDAPVEGGSFTTSSVGSAIHAACRAVLGEVLGHAQKIKGSSRKPAWSRKRTASTRISRIRRCSPRSRSTSSSASSGSRAWSVRWRPVVSSIRRLPAARFSAQWSAASAWRCTRRP
jgi:xanthine dehydrogenase YagR molybdenum-binding subunit